MDWCTIESDPGVFSELIEGIGVENVEVEELIDLDELIAQNRHVYGLIFLFKYVSEPDTRPIDYSPNIYFAKQVIENACATQAILNVLLNRPDVKLGEQLNYFKDFTKDLEPDMRGMAIGNSDQIRLIHNSFSRPEPFLFEKEKEQDQEGEDAFHFIGYVPVGSGLYELDGLKRGPIKVADLSNNDAWKTNQGWLVAAKEAITSRITRYAAKEIRFNLLALTTNRLQECESQLSLLSKKKLAIEKKLSGDAAMDTETGTEVGPLPSAENELKELLTNTVSQLSLLEHSASEEREKRHRWKVENIRRRHNYVPFIFSLLNTLAEKGKLQSLTESAQKVANDRAARLKELKAKKKAEKEKEKEKTAAAS